MARSIVEVVALVICLTGAVLAAVGYRLYKTVQRIREEENDTAHGDEY